MSVAMWRFYNVFCGSIAGGFLDFLCISSYITLFYKVLYYTGYLILCVAVQELQMEITWKLNVLSIYDPWHINKAPLSCLIEKSHWVPQKHWVFQEDDEPACSPRFTLQIKFTQWSSQNKQSLAQTWINLQGRHASADNQSAEQSDGLNAAGSFSKLSVNRNKWGNSVLQGQWGILWLWKLSKETGWCQSCSEGKKWLASWLSCWIFSNYVYLYIFS